MRAQITGNTMRFTDRRSTARLHLGGLAALLVVALAACSDHSPSLQSVAIGGGKAYASVGVPQQLTVTGHYSDGSAVALTKGVRWSSSDQTVATVDGGGVLTAWKAGTAVITATHDSGLAATSDLTSRVVVVLREGATLPGTGTVDTTTSFFRVSGLVPRAFYTPKLSGMTDDVDLAVYSDESLAPEKMLCDSITVGTVPESCIAEANAAGELWIVVDGQWTHAGASFSVDVPGAASMDLAGTLVFPAQLPKSATVGTIQEFYEVTGLTRGAAYEVRISNLTADIDLAVFGDPYEYAALCKSYKSGTADDFCVAKASADGELFVEIDGTTTLDGGSYTLTLAAR
jgi:hypothetical protein